VFLDGDNNVKLGDFGLSKIIQSHDFASTYVGTPYYMSPEVCGNERYSQASDIWSLGCLIYELCTLAPPFNARSHIELFNKIKIGKYPPLPPVYSAELQKVVDSCLQTNPNNRPNTSHFLNLPIVCVMRKQHEAVQLHRELQHKMEDLEKVKTNLRNDIDSSLRREWEVKARLEIDKRVEEEKQRLNGIFEAEVDRRIAAILERQREEASRRSSGEVSLGGATVAENGTNNNSQTSDDGAILRLDRLSLESPAASQEAPRPLRRSSRTPFVRAHTMVANTAEIASPIDIQMADPSPMSIASLALSPRKDGAGSTSTRVPANIFAAAEQGRQRWQPTNASTMHSPIAEVADSLESCFHDSDAEDVIARSPSRDPAKKIATAPKKRISLAHPEKPGTRRLISAPTTLGNHPHLAASALPNASAVPKRPVSAVPVVTTSPTRHKQGTESPSRLARTKTVHENEGTSPIRKAATALGFRLKRDVDAPGPGETMMRTALRKQMNGVHGRTLVELAQARAGGVPRGDKLENVKVTECAVWDPEQDEMPSPFLARGRKVIRSGIR
jgi:serine/threonine-protein kinase Nek2